MGWRRRAAATAVSGGPPQGLLELAAKPERVPFRDVVTAREGTPVGLLGRGIGDAWDVAEPLKPLGLEAPPTSDADWLRG